MSDIKKINFKSFGTDISLSLVVGRDGDLERAGNDLEKCEALYARYQKIFSRFDAESELSKLNGDLRNFHIASDEILEIADKCLKYNKYTEGFFDPRIIEHLEKAGYDKDFSLIGGLAVNIWNFSKSGENRLDNDLKIENGKIFFAQRMDFSGIVKGWATDKIADFLRSRGWKNFSIDSGGDMYFSGNADEEKRWTVDIEGISSRNMKLVLSDKAIATSGIRKRKWDIGGKRFHHLINPKDPDNFSFELQSVTVVADCVEKADVWAKTLFLMGKEKGLEFAKNNNIAGLFLDYRGNSYVSTQFLGQKI